MTIIVFNQATIIDLMQMYIEAHSYFYGVNEIKHIANLLTSSDNMFTFENTAMWVSLQMLIFMHINYRALLIYS